VPDLSTSDCAETVRVLLSSGREWFASAFCAVLEPEGFTFVRVRTGSDTLRDAGRIDPDIVVLDEGLPDLDVADLCRSLTDGELDPSVPILVYCPDSWHENDQAAAMHAGAWDIIKEPVRSRLVTAKLRRLLEIKRLIQVTDERSPADGSGVHNLAGLVRALRVLGSLARRNEASLTCAVLGPTDPSRVADLDALRRKTAALCTANVRGSDACAWLDDMELAVVAFDASVAGATLMVRRLTQVVTEELEAGTGTPWSAGIVELPVAAPIGGPIAARSVGDRTNGDASPVADRIASLSRFAAAQTALHQAREAGGGIRIAALS